MTRHVGAGISSFKHYWNKNSKESLTVILLSNGAGNWTIMPNQINSQIANFIWNDE